MKREERARSKRQRSAREACRKNRLSLCAFAGLLRGPTVDAGRTSSPSFEAADAVALQIDRDVAVADGLELAHDGGARSPAREARAISLRRDLDARQVVVVTDAEHAEAERAQRLLGPLDDPQLLVGHFRVVRDARRQARATPARPRSAARRAATARGFRPWSRSTSSSGLRTPNSRAAWRPAGSRRDRPRCCRRRRPRRRSDHPRQMRVELVLAEVAAVGRVGAVLGTCRARSCWLHPDRSISIRSGRFRAAGQKRAAISIAIRRCDRGSSDCRR